MSELIEFDELDMSELVEAIDTAENRIQFVSAEEDPIPPPPLPPSTLSFHPLDTEALRTWIYPVNYPIRGYQLNIVRKALFHNTLVALPTGLGKTFIAAVVMYNYYRWFPQSKIIFMAPTRPLVTQQIEACFQICGIPQSDTVVLTGTTHVNDRKQLWDTKRVFFITPQILQNDLQTRHCPATRIVCLVADEAHRATGNYAYTDVIKKISRVHEHFRVLALTATPGSNLDTVQSVIKNLHIQSIEIRTEDSMDIQEYSHGKSIQQILVPLEYSKGATGPVPKIMDDFRTKLFKPLLDDLMRHQAFTTSDPDKASPFALMSARLRYSSNATNVAPYVKKKVTRLFLDAEAASRAYDLLSLHGISPFVDALTGADDEKKTVVRINQNPVVVNMVQSLKRQCAESGFIGHPKQERLLSLVLAHVSQAENSMVMIFSSYRSSVLDICNVLNQHKPMIRAAPFVGQSTTKAGEKGLNQNQQYELIRQFKRHEFNVLVATSIGEEGLDIGELDLIICYDSHSSPIRMLQRLGRTGRQRKGQCVLLLTESEKNKYNKAKESYAFVQRMITRGSHIEYYPPTNNENSILPLHYKPTICRKTLEIGTYTQKKKRMTSNNSKLDDTDLLDYYKVSSLSDLFQNHWKKPSIAHTIPLQTSPQKTFKVGHSRRTLQFVYLIGNLEKRIMDPGTHSVPMKRTANELNLPKKKKPKKGKEREFDYVPMLPDSVYSDIEEMPRLVKPVRNQGLKQASLSKYTASSSKQGPSAQITIASSSNQILSAIPSALSAHIPSASSAHIPSAPSAQISSASSATSSAHIPSAPSAHIPLTPSAHIPSAPSAHIPLAPSAHIPSAPSAKIPAVVPAASSLKKIPAGSAVQIPTLNHSTLPVPTIPDDDFGFNDDDFGFDDDLPLDELIEAETMTLMDRQFNDLLDIQFPVHSSQPPITIEWPTFNPPFSQNAIALIKQRQTRVVLIHADKLMMKGRIIEDKVIKDKVNDNVMEADVVDQVIDDSFDKVIKDDVVDKVIENTFDKVVEDDVVDKVIENTFDKVVEDDVVYKVIENSLDMLDASDDMDGLSILETVQNIIQEDENESYDIISVQKNRYYQKPASLSDKSDLFVSFEDEETEHSDPTVDKPTVYTIASSPEPTQPDDSSVIALSPVVLHSDSPEPTHSPFNATHFPASSAEDIMSSQEVVPIVRRRRLHQIISDDELPPKRKRRHQNPSDDVTSGDARLFIDNEAENSEDASEDEDEEDEGSSIMRSFIHDGSSILSNRDVYHIPLSPDRRPRHWLDNFEADKWLAAEDDEEEEEEEEEEEKIGDDDDDFL